jgi:sialate O-acetylesterase
MKAAPRFLLLGLLVALAVARADVTLAPLFTDHAVLQRDKPVPVWGQAAAGEKITVTFARQTRTATAGPDGRWSMSLDKLSASAQGTDLTVAGKNNTLVVHDVVVGEVWLCSGQSNMEFTLEARPGTWQAKSRVRDADKEIAAANFPLIRQVKIERTVAADPAASVATSGWQGASPATVGGFTAVGYFFAREIFQKLGMPIGIVNSSYGGTPVESWMPAPTLARNPAFKVVAERWEKMLADYPDKKAEFDAALAEWTPAETAAKARGEAAHTAWLKEHPKPPAPRGPGDPWTPSSLFNGMISPLAPYAVRGMLWYQGESNAARAAEYQRLFAAMITAWRKQFGQGDFPFFWVNLASYNAPGDTTDQNYAFLREAQTQTLDLPNTGQALAIDIGNPDNIHPTNKQEVGRRLALLAKNRVYGLTGDDTGPTFANVRLGGNGLIVTFGHAGGGLIAHDHPVTCVEVAGTDQVFHPAAVVVSQSVLVAISPEVKQPVAIRYAWRNAPDANLYNGAGLPAVPFRSDNW